MVDKTDWYYAEKTSNIVYSYSPQGTLDVNRLLKNKSYWKKNTSPGIRKKKSLILSDWTAGNWSEEKLQHVIAFIKSLLAEKFPVYIWQGSHLLEITKDNLDLLKSRRIRNNISPALNPAIISKAAIEHKLSHDQLKIIDHYRLNCILAGKEDLPEYELDIKEILHSRHERNYLFDYLGQAKPLIQTIGISELSRDAHDLIKSLQKLLPEAKISGQVKKLKLDYFLIARLKEKNNYPYLTFADWEKVTDLSLLEELDLSSWDEMPNDTLQDMLLKTPNLKILKLPYISDHKLFSFTQPIYLPHLEELKAINLHINTDFIENFLVHATKLKSVNFSGSTFDLDLKNNVHLPALEEVDLSRCKQLSTDSLQKLLAYNSGIKKVNLSHFLNNPQLTMPFNWPNLEKIIIVNFGLTINDFNLLFPANLKITQCLCSPKLAGFLDLSRIETLGLSYDIKGYENTITGLLSEKKQLKTLNLTNFKFNTQEYPCLPILRKLKVTFCEGNITNLQNLVNNTPQLNELALCYCPQLAGGFNEHLNLSSLTTLELRKSGLHNSDLQILLRKNPHLTSLTIEDEALDFDCEGINFANLEQLCLRNTSLSGLNLQKIIANAPRLKKISIHNCENLSEPLARNLNFNLENLQQLTITFSDISPSFLTEMVDKAPALKAINWFDEDFGDFYLNLHKKIRNRRWFQDKLRIDLNKLLPPTTQLTDSDSPPQECQKPMIDMDTNPSIEHEFKVNRVFYALDDSDNPDVASYRGSVYNRLKFNPNICQPNDAVELANEGDLDLVDVKITQWKEDLLAYGKSLKPSKQFTRYYAKEPPLRITSQWQALHSLSANEKITHYHINPPASVEIKYSKRDNLYYIRSTGEDVNASLDFLVQIPKQTIKLPARVRKLAKDISAFEAKTLKLPSKPLTGAEYLDEIERQRVGACRHRAIAFHDLVNRNWPDISTRIVTNNCHAFVEIKHEGQWVKQDLGGYPAKLTIQDAPLPKPSVQQTQKPAQALQIQQDKEPLPPPQLEAQIPYEQWFKNHFSTWEIPAQTSLEPLAYYQAMLKNSSKKNLIQCKSTEQVNALSNALLNHCRHQSRPVFFVRSPDDLICSAQLIKKTGEQGVLTNGPGGPLYDFLQTHQDPANPPVLLVNYDAFENDDLVRFNGLLDTKRHADGTFLPKEALVIGLQNKNKPDCYNGDDFYSRFEQRLDCSFSVENLKKTYPQLPIEAYKEDQDGHALQLFKANDWEERLLGRWVVQGKTVVFQEGLLKKALESNKPLIIENGLWQDPAFINFWQQAFVQGSIRHADGPLKIPPTLRLIAKEGYDWAKLQEQVQFIAGFSDEADVLNPGTLNRFFTRYDCNNITQELATLPGLIKENRGKTLHVNLTRSLTEDEWAMLLTKCSRYQVKLVSHCVPSVELPHVFTPPVFAPGSQPDKDLVQVIESSDPDTTVELLKANDKEAIVIDVSEYEANDLIFHLDGQFDKKQLCFKFQAKEQAVIQALAENKSVILTGCFSADLADALAPLLLAPREKGKLTVVSNETSLFDFITLTQQVITPDLKKQALALNYQHSELIQLRDNFYQQESLSRLKARLNFLRRHPEKDSKLAWEGMYDLPPHPSLADWNLADSEAISARFTQSRLDAVNAVLTQVPFVVLTGLTGVGKSTFVQKELKRDGYILYEGEARLREWAMDTSKQDILLFIDEANDGNTDWSRFEGLHQTPPTILIDGKLVPLSKHHKIVFAENPLKYGGERQSPSLFERHGNALVFDPLPAEYIYEKILKPVMAKTSLADQTQAVAQALLPVYQFLCNASDKKEVLITARELQMMALLTINYHQQNPDQDPVLAARHYAFTLGENLVPNSLREAFIKQFKPQELFFHPEATSKPQSKYIVTPSRQPLCQQLDDLLNLRQWRQSAPKKAQRYGGLGGLVIEGAPAVGKSELVIDRLLAHGFEEVSLQTETIPDKPFYRMPVSMSFTEKQALLLKAFDQGAVVMVDEINSSPMMERLLNGLLMGKNPEGKRPQKPGFTLIGTQNPVTLAGRRPPSNALARRLISTTLHPLPYEEKLTIIQNRGVPETIAKTMVSAFESQVKHAADNHLSPAPTFRHLVRLAKQFVKGAFQSAVNTVLNINQPANQSREHRNNTHRLKQLIQTICNDAAFWKTLTRVGTLPHGVKKIKDILETNPETDLNLIAEIATDKHSHYFQFFHNIFRGRDSQTNHFYKVLSQINHTDDSSISRTIEQLMLLQTGATQSKEDSASPEIVAKK